MGKVDMIDTLDEIEAIKKAAYLQGVEDGKKQNEMTMKQIKEEAREVAILRSEWKTMINMLFDHLNNQNDVLELLNNNLFDSTRLTEPKDWNQFQEEIGRLMKMGMDFENLLKGINEHAVLKGCWDKLIMTFKLIES